MNFTQLKNQVQCLLDRVTTLEAGGGGGGGNVATQITSPVVTSLDDNRGVVGDWSYDPNASTGPTFYQKVSVSPHTWVAFSVSTAIP